MNLSDLMNCRAIVDQIDPFQGRGGEAEAGEDHSEVKHEPLCSAGGGEVHPPKQISPYLLPKEISAQRRA